MTRDTRRKDKPNSLRRGSAKQWLMLSLLVAAMALAVTGLLLSVGSGAAADTDYYNNSSGVVQPDSPDNVTLDSLVGLAVELAPSFIGTGEQDPSGTGFQGVLLTGTALAFTAVAMMAGTGIGTVGGTIMGLVVGYGLVDAGFAPPWIKPLLLLGLGVVVYIAVRKAFQGT